MTEKPESSRPGANEAVALRRRLREDAREILRSALTECVPEKVISSLLRRADGFLEGPGFRLKIGRRIALILSYGKASFTMAGGTAKLLSPGAMDGLMVHPEESPSTAAPGLRPLPAVHPFPDLEVL